MAKNRNLSVGLVFDDSLDRPDGVSQYVKTLGAWLSRQGYDVSYLVGETKIKTWAGGKVYSLSKNQVVNFNGNKLSMPLPGNSRAIKKLLNDQRFDVLHVMVPYSPFMAARVIKYASKQTAVIGTFHIFPSGIMSEAGSRLLRLVLSNSWRRFYEIVSVSQATADFARTHYRIKTSVVPNPVDIAAFKTSKVEDHKNEIIFLGRLVKRKGASYLIDAFEILCRINPDARLVIAGDGADRPKLQAKVRHLGLSDKIKFLGYIKESDKPSLLAQAAIACFPSLYGEAFGIVLIEAMAAGTKVVLAGDNPGYRSVLGGNPELLVDPTDTPAFARRLNELLSDENKRRSIHEWQDSEIERYDIEVVGKQLVQIYDSAIARLNKKSHNNAHG